MPEPLKLFPAQLTALPDILAYMDDFYTHIDFNILRRAKIIVEELFTNSIKYGHAEDTGEKIRIELFKTLNGICICFEDHAPPFNPLAEPDSFTKRLADSCKPRDEGGFGHLLIKNLADAVHYAYIDGHNRIELSFSISSHD